MPSIPIDRFARECEALYTPPIRAKATLTHVRQVLREIQELDDVNTTEDLTPAMIARWIAAYPDRSAERATTNLRCLSALCTFAVASRYLDVDPFDFRAPKVWMRADAKPSARAGKKLHRSRDEIAALLALVDEEAANGDWHNARLQALVYVYAYLGLRKNEALYLECSNVDLFAQSLTIEAKPEWKPKTAKSAAKLPMPGALTRVMLHWIPRTRSRWLFPGVRGKTPWISGPPGYKPLDQIKAAGKRAKIENLTIASFRKTIGTNAKAWGLGQLELKSILRHTNTKTQEFYDEEDLEILRHATSKIDFPRLAAGG